MSLPSGTSLRLIEQVARDNAVRHPQVRQHSCRTTHVAGTAERNGVEQEHRRRDTPSQQSHERFDPIPIYGRSDNDEAGAPAERRALSRQEVRQ